MNEKLKVKLESLPLSPGCYIMKNSNDQVIYVGKAKKLKNRVNSYFTGAHDYKTTKLVSNIVDFDFIVTDSEKEALLLEINLIKKYRPRFNISFMDDKSYPYVKLTSGYYPALQVVREAKKDRKAKYFGPYPDATAAHSTVKLLNELYPLRKCKNIPKKVCLYYHLGQCLGPCEFEVSEDEYKPIVEEVTRFLNGDVNDLIKRVTSEMNEASESLEYEKAQAKYQILKSIEHISDRQNVDQNDNVNRDIFNYYSDNGYIAIFGLLIRAGKLIERELIIQPLYDDPTDVFVSVLSQYYEKNTLPRQICLPEDSDVELLRLVLDTEVIVPKRGKYRRLMELAKENAEKNLKIKFESLEKMSDFSETSISELSKILNIDNLNRFEVFDISHTSGAYTVGGMIVYEDYQYKKSDYRKFRLHTQNSDTDSMKETLYRRYFRAIKEGLVLPDVIIMDGGINQINAGKEVLEMLHLDIPIYGLVKDDKHNTSNLLNYDGEVITIDKTSNAFFFLVQLQDEVHRFAISYHKKLRTSNMTKSILDEVDGIGPKRKKELLKHFKSFTNIKSATIEQLIEVLPEKVAHDLYETLHQDFNE